MESLDLKVLTDAKAWKHAGHIVTLVTVVETWGSAPRPPGALLAVRGDGVVSGSVSGGCVEDDLIARVKAGERTDKPSMIAYGVTKAEAARFGIPCGGSLRLVQEPLTDTAWVEQILQRTAAHELVARHVTLATGLVSISPAQRNDTFAFDGITLKTTFGPKWRMLLIGAGQLSQAVAQMASMLDFEVLVCDPREEYAALLPAGATRVLGMPDDVVRDLHADAHTAIVALTHDPKLDDMALMEALRSDAFYIGALGSQRNTDTRKTRLKEYFELTDAQVDRLHGPVGLRLGAKTPAEIAVSIIAQIVQVKNTVHAGAAVAQGCDLPAVAQPAA
jgi:xanthine dehydrogenase accessory factor